MTYDFHEDYYEGCSDYPDQSDWMEEEDLEDMGFFIEHLPFPSPVRPRVIRYPDA